MSQSNNGSGPLGAAGTYGARTRTGELPGRRRQRLIGIILAVILLLLVLLLLFFFPRPTATVTLTPMSKALRNTSVIDVVARALNSTQQDAQTGIPSGPPAQGTHATGMLTFWNYTPSWVTIAARTQLTNAAGQQVVTDKDLRVPPDPIIPGIASVSAHALKVGKSGNIDAMSINKVCCFAGISVTNAAAYHGGRDAQKFPVVRQSDLDTVVNTLKTSLTQKALAAMRLQLKTDESLVNAEPQCKTKITSTPGVGASVATFTVTVALTCTDSAYNPQAAVQQAVALLKQQAAQQLDPGFVLVGTIVSTIEKNVPGSHNHITVLVAVRGEWKYQFTTSQKQQMAQSITRKTVNAAKTLLLQ